MHLYHFTVNNYGASWYVAAASREAAIEAVRTGIQAEYERQRVYEQDDEDRKWGITPEQLAGAQTIYEKRAASRRDKDLKTLQCMIDGTGSYEGDDDKCSIDEYPIGHVIFSEVS